MTSWSTTVRAIETPRGARYIGTCYESRGPDSRGRIGPVPRGARVIYETRPLRSANDAREYARGRTIHHNLYHDDGDRADGMLAHTARWCHEPDAPRAECGTCGDTGRRCRFERACSCWRGVPCRRVAS